MSTSPEEKYSKELKVINNIAFNFVLPDAEAEFNGLTQANALIGFGKRDTGAITFNISEEVAHAQSDQYRTTAESHANQFAEAFNRSLVAQGPQGPVPLLEKDIVNVEGNTVHFDLAGLRKLLADHAIADQLPQISKSYSVQYHGEQATREAPYVVESTIQQKHLAQQQEQLKGEVLEACNKAVDDPKYLAKLAQSEPELAQMVQGTLQNAVEALAQIKEQPEILEQVRESDPEFADLLDKISEKQKAKQQNAASDKAPANDDKTEQGRFAQQVEERRASAEQTHQR